MALGRPDAAIVALWQAFAIDTSTESERALMLAYREAYPGGCAETSHGSMKPNLNCPLLRAQACSAYEGLVRALGETGLADKAHQYQQTAVHDYGCTLQTGNGPKRHRASGRLQKSVMKSLLPLNVKSAN